jgi:hypothetical protein
VARGTAEQEREADIAKRSLDLLDTAFTRGDAYTRTCEGGIPEHPEYYGWRQKPINTGSGVRLCWEPQGALIGWCDENGLYLDSPAAFAALQRIGRETGEPLPVGRTAWHRALLAKGLLAKRDEGRRTHTYRRTIEGCMRSVLWLCKLGVYRGENADIADSGESGNSG